ncbi:hypothetical protein V5O48_013199 [Marasmius crinis-equi]|uniref:Uncharacterized protein n=1 Tax=Marasmius crinis-equi TaxID=585013 RepID=A0ABR3F0T0_9AGAR
MVQIGVCLKCLSSASSVSSTGSLASSQLHASQTSTHDDTPLLTRNQKRKRRDKERGKQKMKKVKAEKNKQGSNDRNDPSIRSYMYKRHVQGVEAVVAEGYALDVEAPVCSTGYICRDDQVTYHHPFWLHELVGPSSRFKMREIKWNGKYATHSCAVKPRLAHQSIYSNRRRPIPILNEDGRVIALLAGRPRSCHWRKIMHEAANLLEILRGQCNFFNSKGPNRRGDFGALNVGISFGGGQVVVLDQLLVSKPFRFMSGFSNSELALPPKFEVIVKRDIKVCRLGVFKTWQPDLHGHYRDTMRVLVENDKRLSLPFANSVFACAAFNFGPQTVCVDHLDHSNFPPGWCGIWSLGSFNPKRGGHLVLQDLGIVVRFPPGSLILVPSASCRHENAKIAEGETRYSFTQFSAGGLFRWVEHGCQSETNYGKALAKMSEEERAAQVTRDKRRWLDGLSLVSLAKDLGIKVPQAAAHTS